MRRREFITFLPALLPGHSPHARKTEASSFGSDFSVRLAQTVCGNAQTFRDGLRVLGHDEGRDIVIEARWADGHYERLPGLLAELA
jgi:putative tryptophan/tyrosine transport system substrate-binding protein